MFKMQKNILPENSVCIVYDVMDECEKTDRKLRIIFKDREEPLITYNEGENLLPNRPCHSYSCNAECKNCAKIFSIVSQQNDNEHRFTNSHDIKDTKCSQTSLKNSNFIHNIPKRDINISNADLAANNISDAGSVNVNETICSDPENVDSNTDITSIEVQCPNCSFTCLDCNELQIHCKAIHNNLTPFDCFACDERFAKYKEMMKHLGKVHDENDMIRCKICNFYVYLKQVVSHVMTCKASKPYRCKYCPKRYVSEEQKGNHEERHNQNCSYCGLSFFLYSDYSKHIKTHQEKITNTESAPGQNEIPSSRFEKQLKDSLSILPNESVAQTDDHDSECPDLLPEPNNEDEEIMYTQRREGLSLRNGNLHQPTNLQTSENIFRKWCPHCKATFYKQNRLVRHCKIAHKSSKPYGCYSCSACFTTAKQRTNHLTVVHNSTHKIVCKFCSNCVKTENKMNMHIVRCTKRNKQVEIDDTNNDIASNNQISCTDCNEQFETNYALHLHSVLHHGKDSEKKSNPVLQLFVAKPLATMQMENENSNSSVDTRNLIHKLAALTSDSDSNIDLIANDLQDNASSIGSNNEISNQSDVESNICDKLIKSELDDDDSQPPVLELIENPYNLPPRNELKPEQLFKIASQQQMVIPEKHSLKSEDNPPILEPQYIPEKSLAYLNKTHKKIKMVVCKLCGASVASSYAFVKHLIECISRRLMQDNENINSKTDCPLCYRPFDSYTDLLKHVKDLHGHFICYTCDAKFLTMENRRDHLNDKHYGVNKIVCKICKKTFTSETRIRNHMKKRRLGKRHQCLYRPTSFTNKDYHQKHLEQHWDNKFKCTECTQRFATIQGLSHHKKIHKNGGPHKCTMCSAGYITIKNLKKHIALAHQWQSQTQENFLEELNESFDTESSIEDASNEVIMDENISRPIKDSKTITNSSKDDHDYNFPNDASYADTYESESTDDIDYNQFNNISPAKVNDGVYKPIQYELCECSVVLHDVLDGMASEEQSECDYNIQIKEEMIESDYHDDSNNMDVDIPDSKLEDIKPKYVEESVFEELFAKMLPLVSESFLDDDLSEVDSNDMNVDVSNLMLSDIDIQPVTKNLMQLRECVVVLHDFLNTCSEEESDHDRDTHSMKIPSTQLSNDDNPLFKITHDHSYSAGPFAYDSADDLGSEMSFIESTPYLKGDDSDSSSFGSDSGTETDPDLMENEISQNIHSSHLLHQSSFEFCNVVSNSINSNLLSDNIIPADDPFYNFSNDIPGANTEVQEKPDEPLYDEVKECVVVLHDFLKADAPEEIDCYVNSDNADVDVPNAQLSNNNTEVSLTQSADNTDCTVTRKKKHIGTDVLEKNILTNEAEKQLIADNSDD